MTRQKYTLAERRKYQAAQHAAYLERVRAREERSGESHRTPDDSEQTAREQT